MVNPWFMALKKKRPVVHHGPQRLHRQIGSGQLHHNGRQGLGGWPEPSRCLGDVQQQQMGCSPTSLGWFLYPLLIEQFAMENQNAING